MKKDNSNHRTLIVTGMTDDEVRHDLRQMEETGINPALRCHFCHRREGNLVVAVENSGDSEPLHGVITLDTIERSYAGDTLLFRVCMECNILLGLDDSRTCRCRKDEVCVPVSMN